LEEIKQQSLVDRTICGMGGVKVDEWPDVDKARKALDDYLASPVKITDPDREELRRALGLRR
jgi:hypothetical protein